MTTRPPVDTPIEYGNASSFWVEYPSGLVDLTRTAHLPTPGTTKVTDPPPLSPGQLDVPVDGQGQRRSVRINAAASAYVIIDMQKYVPPSAPSKSVRPDDLRRAERTNPIDE